ncbi:hypothetical protein FOL47_003539 [Perkinsus chesapeaki]|uniref:Uncharacterized protein n=1 Tax=Perkinsus chesapeaki TaxID=330153 RepID=A0A7J6MZN0_PERCH|nr:hypothetical protein FOL47_003539 [Perkinsus chesapeaki]
MSHTADSPAANGATFLTDVPESSHHLHKATTSGALSVLALNNTPPCSLDGHDMKFLEKVHYAPPLADYYESFPMKPGVDYFGSLVRFREVERMQMMLGNLRVRWPRTWCFCGLDTYIFSNSDKKGITVEYDFVREREAQRLSKLGGHSEKDVPVVVYKQRAYGPNKHLHRTTTTALNVPNALVRLQQAGGGHTTQVLQRFIKGPGEHACITRVCYRTKHPRKPVGYSIANGYSPSDLEDLRNERHDLTQQYCASTETSVPGGLVVFKRSSGRALEEAADIAERMLIFSENYFLLKLDWIVVDVLSDRKGRLWCLQVKSFRVSTICRPPRRSLSRPKPVAEGSPSSKLQLALMRQGTESAMAEGSTATAAELEESRAKAFGASVKYKRTCSLCRCTMTSEQHRAMTGRMLLWVWHSLRAREVHVFPPLQSSLLASTSHVANRNKVCQLCWSVFLAEKELWRTHRAIANIVTGHRPPSKEKDDFDFTGILENLPFVENIRTHRKGSSQQPKRNTPCSQGQLLAIADATPTAPIGDRGPAGGAVRAIQATEEGLQSPRPEYMHQWRLMILLWSVEGLPHSTASNGSIQYQVLGMQRKFALPDRNRRNAAIGKIGVHYVFSETPRPCLSNGYIEFRLLGVGSGYRGRYSIDSIAGLGKHTVHVLMSAKDGGRPTMLKVTLGMVRDGTLCRDYCDIQKALDGVYIVNPKTMYSSHHPLPTEWIETFQECRKTCGLEGTTTNTTSSATESQSEAEVSSSSVPVTSKEPEPNAPNSRPTTAGHSTRPPSAAQLLEKDRKTVASVLPRGRVLSRQSDSLGFLARPSSAYPRLAHSSTERRVTLEAPKLNEAEAARVSEHLEKLRQKIGGRTALGEPLQKAPADRTIRESRSNLRSREDSSLYSAAQGSVPAVSHIFRLVPTNGSLSMPRIPIAVWEQRPSAEQQAQNAHDGSQQRSFDQVYSSPNRPHRRPASAFDINRRQIR